MLKNSLICGILVIMLLATPAFGINNTKKAGWDDKDNINREDIPKSNAPRIPNKVSISTKGQEKVSPNVSPIIPNTASTDNLKSFDRPYAEGELSSYAYLNRTSLFSQTYDPLAPVTTLNSYIADVKLDSLGNLYVLGGIDLCSSTFTLATSTGNEISSTNYTTGVCFLGFILKYSSTGTQLYGSVIDNPIGDNASYSTFEFDASGNIYILGTVGPLIDLYNSDNARTDNTDVFIIKMDSSFNVVKNVTIGGDYLERAGIKVPPAFYFLQDTRRYLGDDLLDIDPFGDIVISGSTTSFSDTPITQFPVVEPTGGTNDPTWNLLPSSSGENAFVMKLDSNLNIKWSRMFTGNTTTATTEKVGALAVGPDGRIYIGGTTTSDALPYGLVYPLNDTATNGETSVNHQRTLAKLTASNTQEAFVAVFEPNGTLHTMTYLGSSTSGRDYIYSMIVDSNNILYVAGETDAASGAFPLISPIENDAGFSETIFDKKSWTGFLLSYDTRDYNMTFSHRFIMGNSSAIMDLQVVGDLVYYSGIGRFDYFSNFTLFSTPGYEETHGYYADDTFSIGIGQLEKDYSAAFVGLINSSRRITFQSFTDFSEDTITKPPNNNTVGSDELSAMSRAPIVVNEQTSEFIVGIDNFLGTHLKKLNINDTDNDGISNWNEVNRYLTDPNNRDSDGDGIIDGLEVYGLNSYGWPSNPLDEDTDDDCINDYLEIINGLNPAIPDTGVDLDGDGLSSWDEYGLGLNITNPDTDGDGLTDFEEVFVTFTNGSSPDTDKDNLTDYEEYLMGWDPNDPDMDNDGLTDGVEYTATYLNATNQPEKTDPFNPDTDGDGLIDSLERVLYIEGYSNNRTNPLLYDSDGDGLSDYDEYIVFATAPYNADMDGDQLNDTEELLIYFTNVTNPDSDGDGFTDGEEVLTNAIKTDPLKWDTDGDSLSDYDEIVTYGTDPLSPDIDGDGLWDAYEIAFGSDPYNNDTDGDLLPDLWEYEMGLSASTNETYTDADGDNMTALMEYYNGTHPLFADIDKDNLTDLEELTIGTDPWFNDTDHDQIVDGEEVRLGTSPFTNDTDGDSLSDFWEVNNGFNATNPDMDADGLFDGFELDWGTDPFNNDTDSDGLIDGLELYYTSDPFKSDTDGDTLTDSDEVFKYFTSPVLKDTDSDGLQDNKEIDLGTLPYDPDTDKDNLIDGDELRFNSDPFNNDTDSDSILDGDEVAYYGTSPTLNDTDSDGMPDPWEIKYMMRGDEKVIDPLVDDADQDPDNDGLTNLEEYKIGTNPLNPDTDGDEANDGWEVERKNRDPLDPSDRYRGELIKQIQEGFKLNPGLGWTSLVVFIGANIIFMKMIFDSLKLRRKR